MNKISILDVNRICIHAWVNVRGEVEGGGGGYYISTYLHIYKMIINKQFLDFKNYLLSCYIYIN